MLLWMKREIVEEEPEDLHNDQSRPKELAEDASLRCPRQILPVVPIHDHPSGGHEIWEVVGVIIV